METITKIPQITISLSFDKKVRKSELRKINTSKDTADICREVFNKDTFEWTEEMILLCLNRANKVVGFYKVSQGGISWTYCDPKVVFTVALTCGASSIILVHNHPSGNLQPSNEDKKLTDRIKQGGRMLDITLIDSLIITDESYYSFADEGLI